MASSTEQDAYRFVETDGGKQRFSVELEFVQALANPSYIHYLAQNRYFDDAAFVKYLKYLQYWKRQPYAQYISFPHCLFFLDLLQSPSFREAMAHHENKELAHKQQYYYWFHYRNNRLKQLQAHQQSEATIGGAVPQTENGTKEEGSLEERKDEKETEGGEGRDEEMKDEEMKDETMAEQEEADKTKQELDK